jgi:hypothetical protein
VGQGFASPPGLTPNQKAALNANVLLDAANYVAGIDDTGEGGGASAGFTITATTFAWNTTSPVTLQVLATGEIVCKVILDITTAFDAASSLSVGHTGSATALMDTSQSDSRTAGWYEVVAHQEYGGADAAYLHITPGASSQGAGRVWVISKKA